MLSEPSAASTGESKFWKHYDRIYAGKDYDAEVAAILPYLGTARTLLDVGCGTGEHTRRFARHLGAVLGIDTEAEAIAIAKRKGQGSNFAFANKRPDELDGSRFSAAVALFNVVHYQQTMIGLLAFFKAVSDRLMPGAPFIFDCWNAEAVLLDPPELMDADGIARTPTLNRVERTCEVRMVCDIDGDKFTQWFFHKLWTISEIRFALLTNGFGSISVCRWMALPFAATPQDWKIMFYCEKGQ